MGRKSSQTGQAYRNPVEHYRKQLGRNEERPAAFRPRWSRSTKQRHLSPRELARSKLLPRNWKVMLVYLALFVAIMAALYLLVMVEAGSYLYALLIEEDAGRTSNVNSQQRHHSRVHRDM